MKLYRIDTAQSLYWIEHASGFSSYGFDVLHRKATAIRAWRGDSRPILAELGTAEHFTECSAEFALGAAHAAKTGTRCDGDLSPALLGLEGKRVEVLTPDGETERFYVGRSTGWMPCHLAVSRRGSGGPAAYVPAGSTVRVIR